MHHTSLNHGRTAALEDATTSALNYTTLKNIHNFHLQKMDQSTQNLEYWDTLWLLLLKNNLVEFSTIGKQLYPS